MPRIDPDRLLKTLAPLLEPHTGAVKSEKEVDKIYGLMSKFSKKLVSKCTYINILKSSKPDVLDLFFVRGGWDMVHGWTTEACEKRNYELLKEIADLLLYAPATVQRLKENDLPKLVKMLSRDCENEELKEIAKKIVDKWVAIAKQQDISSVIVAPNVYTQSQLISSGPINNGNLESSDAKVENSVPVGDTAQSDFYMDLNMDLNEFDFNPEVFSKVVDHDFTVSNQNAASTAAPSATDVPTPNPMAVCDSNINSTSTSVIQPNPQAASANFLITSGTSDGASNVVSKLTIKTVDGKKAVVQGVNPPEPVKQEAPYYLIMKDGKPFLVRMKLATPGELLPSAIIQQTSAINVQPVGAGPATGDEKKKRPRKDPSIAAAKSASLMPGEEKHRPNILKTYSKKNPMEDAIETDSQADTGSKPKSSSETTSKSSSGDKKTSSKKHRHGTSSSSAAAKKLDDDKLREKIRQEKLNVKKRQKDAAKQKQQEKDQETLKKLNLTAPSSGSNSSPSSSKIPKIPKKASSFADAIGIPGATDTAVPVKDRSSKSSSSKSKSKPEDSPSKHTESAVSGVKFYGRKEEDTSKKADEKDRKHSTVKVFSSKKSRSDGLLKDMTETVKPNKNNKSESVKENESGLGDKSLVKSGQKPEKRPSIEGIEKPGDSKKPKMSHDEKKAQKEKAKADGRLINVIKESSLFMDALIGSSDTQKEKKRKRRPSLTNDKDPSVSKPNIRTNGGATGKDLPTPSEVTSPEKPVFNFYRDTLADNETSSTEENVEETTEPRTTADTSMEVDGEEDTGSPSDHIDNDSNAEFKLKSALVIHRSRNKPKKSVRWREEEEIKEVFTFEMDETERVNVTRQIKDFSSMKELEKAEEKQFLTKSLKQRILGEEEEGIPWKKPFKLIVDNREFPPITSEEKDVQEERERLTLGVFLPPGSLVPSTPAEPDPLSPNRSEETSETRIIPVDDVPNVTKAYDKSDIPWPEPKDRVGYGIGVVRPSSNAPPAAMDNAFGMTQMTGFGTGSMNVPSHLNVNAHLPVPGFNPIPNGMDFNNPWSLAVPPPNVALPGMNDMSAFNINQLPGNPNPMAMLNVGFPNIPPPANPFSMVPNFSHPPPGMRFPPPPQTPLLPNPTNMNNFNRGNLGRGDLHNSVPGRGGHTREFGDRDHRRPYREDRDDRSQRGNYDSRGRSSRDNRSRDYDRDRRSPSPNRRRRDDRDRDRHTARDAIDSRDRDYRSRGRSGKTEIQCKFFSKGNCHNGSRCEFSHSQDGSSKHARDRSSPPPRNDDTGSGSDSPVEITSQFERRPSRDDTTATNFTDAPSSPACEIIEDPSLLLPPGISEPAKIIPVE